MTRSQRRARAQARRRQFSHSPGRFGDTFSRVVGDHLNRNPNGAKHGAARMGLDGFDPTTGRYVPTLDDIRAKEARRDYRPLKVTTTHNRDRAGRKLPASRVTQTSYTV